MIRVLEVVAVGAYSINEARQQRVVAIDRARVDGVVALVATARNGQQKEDTH